MPSTAPPAPWPSALQRGPCESCGQFGRRLVRVQPSGPPAPSFAVCEGCASDQPDDPHPEAIWGAAGFVPHPGLSQALWAVAW